MNLCSSETKHHENKIITLLGFILEATSITSQSFFAQKKNKCILSWIRRHFFFFYSFHTPLYCSFLSIKVRICSHQTGTGNFDLAVWAFPPSNSAFTASLTMCFLRTYLRRTFFCLLVYTPKIAANISSILERTSDFNELAVRQITNLPDGFNGFQTNISATLVQGSCFLAQFVCRPRPF